MNLIGAVRPYEMVKHLTAAGHEVQVLTTSGNPVPENYDADLSGLSILRVPIPRILRFLEGPANGLLGVFKKLLVRFFYPDQYVLCLRSMVRAGIKCSPDSDLIISSALPFSVHMVAAIISSKIGKPWIADNRDLWANTPYRRSFLGSNRLDLCFERAVLRRAKANIVVGRSMQQTLSQRLGKAPDCPDVQVLMNGADSRIDERYVDYAGTGEPLRFVYTGSLYRGKRDLTPLFNSLRVAPYAAEVLFYGADADIVSGYQHKYPELRIRSNTSVSKKEIKAIQQSAHFLVLALTTDPFEKTVLTGKFFEYLESGRPIIALCDTDSDLAELVRTHNLGCASRDANKIGSFVESVVRAGAWSGRTPEPLTREHQMREAFQVLGLGLVRSSLALDIENLSTAEES